MTSALEQPASFDALSASATDGQRPFDWQQRLPLATPMPEVVKVATGAGKTEGAVLSWLWRRRHGPEAVRAATSRRLVYCLPMRTLVEQTAARVSQQLARVAPDIAVHQLMGGAVARDWIDRPGDDAVLVGTLDQLLSRAPTTCSRIVSAHYLSSPSQVTIPTPPPTLRHDGLASTAPTADRPLRRTHGHRRVPRS